MKQLTQLWSAIATLALGHVLVYLDFFARGYVHGNTLMYFGQCLIPNLGLVKYRQKGIYVQPVGFFKYKKGNKIRTRFVKP